ncbi:MAG: pyruvate:ferredoxin (flavodoxin) oxidoreductase [Synergistaceae bacterium]|nr:pyruvate:ferredoxin (flavodoxin) oxidoreductase [Synergistaceae bacterium]
MAEQFFETMDGNTAAAYVAYAFTEIAAIYPITPSSPMAGTIDAWSAAGRKNIFNQVVSLTEMQSEAGAAAAVQGALEAGALATSFTSSQGLMLMLPVLHRFSGNRLPAVLHIASRTVGTHAFSIFGDHSDVMNCRSTGMAQLCSSTVQEVADMAIIAHTSAVKASIPFMHFFDGFRTSHELDKISLLTYEDMASLLDYEALSAFKSRALNPEHPVMHATVQNPDIFFQIREANNGFYSALPNIVQENMDRLAKLTGRQYHIFDYFGAEDAELVIVAMGSVSGNIKETVGFLNNNGQRVGFLQVRLYRPFDFEKFVAALPKSVKKIAVLDRTKEMGSNGEPLFQDVCSALKKASRDILVVGGRYGLSSKDTASDHILSVFENLACDAPKDNFTIGITDDVTNLSLTTQGHVPSADCYSCKFWGLGGDGTVGANKDTVHIINENTSNWAQAYFEYDAKKSFGVTISHVKFGANPIKTSCLVKHADFVAAHNKTYIQNYDIVSELKEGGILLLNCPWSADQLDEKIPADIRQKLFAKKAKLYIMNAREIAEKNGLGNHVNIPLQAAFFALTNILPEKEYKKYMALAIRKKFFAKGEDVVAKNIATIDAGAAAPILVPIPAYWQNSDVNVDSKKEGKHLPEIVTKILAPINRCEGDSLPVSAFKKYTDGTIELGLTAYEKRAIATKVPEWDPAKCIQCNRCSYVCPHAVIRPYILTKVEVSAAPKGFKVKEAIGAKGMFFSLQISRDDCTGCGSCYNVCPAKEKAISPIAIEDSSSLPEEWNYALSLPERSDLFDQWSVKGSQFKTPLLEFSAACAGCGETPYAKLMTQLFGDRVYWANATGCSQAWGAAMPGIPYTKNKEGRGPAWSNSLFENNAEFSLGMYLSVTQQRVAVKQLAEQLLTEEIPGSLKEATTKWLESFEDFDASRQSGEDFFAELIKVENPSKTILQLISRKDHFAKKTFWMFGGDGWAYDIGFGGLDHVMAQGLNINALIVDTEVYSNTGGQSSKATPLGAVAQFTTGGKKTGKKDLGAILMSYGYIYVASVAMGADMNQLVKALKEAEEYPGPSVVIAYAPCVAHGIKKGMAYVQEEMADAVASGYWTLYRYDPRKERPLTIDSKEPSKPLEDFLLGETRYESLTRTFPESAKVYFAKASDDAKKRYEKYKSNSEK